MVMVMMMLVLFSILVIMMVMATLMLLILIVVMMLMLLHTRHHLTEHFLLHIVRLGDDLHQLCTAELCCRRGDHCGLRIQRLDDLHSFIHLLLLRHIGSGENHGTGILDLVVEKLTEVLRIELGLLRIHYGHGSMQLHLQLARNGLHRTDNVGELADT